MGCSVAERHRTCRCGGLDLAQGPVVLQLSTYSANNANSQDDVILSIEPIFNTAGLELAAIVRADGNMMSMVFSRAMRCVHDAEAGLQTRLVHGQDLRRVDHRAGWQAAFSFLYHNRQRGGDRSLLPICYTSTGTAIGG